MEYITMRNGTKVPMLGLGCYKSEEQEGVEAVKSAIEIGYRHIDTAKIICNISFCFTSFNDGIKWLWTEFNG